MSYHGFGRIPYTTIISKRPEYIWSYSNTELEETFNALLQGKRLKKVFTGLCGYIDGAQREENYYDFTYMGGTVLMVFSHNIALEIAIHAEGMIEYRIHSVSDLEFHHTKDFPPEDLVLSEKYFYDMKEVFELTYEGEFIDAVQVDGADTYAFSARNFDQEKATLAMYQKKLPTNLHFKLSNGVDFGIYGDVIEYFDIYLKKE